MILHPQEEWRKIIIENHITNYEISSYGRCRNITKLHWKTGGILKPRKTKTGYWRYNICYNNKIVDYYAHRLVAMFFIDINKINLTVNHIDGDKDNNHVSNLEWVTMSENNAHASKLGLMGKAIERYSLEGKFIDEFTSATEAGRKLGIKAKNINQALLGNTLHANRFQWKFKNNNKSMQDISKIIKNHSTGVVQLTLNNEYITEYDKLKDAYIVLNKTDNGAISQVCKGNRHSFAGYKWMYKSDYYNTDKDIV